MSYTRRYYLSASGAAAVSPAFAGYWSTTTGADRRSMSETPGNTTQAGKGTTESVSGNVHALIRQFVGPADLPAGEVTGFLSTSVIAEESNVDANMFLDLVVKVVSSDGSTVRGTIYPGQGSYASSASSSSPQYEFPQTPTRLSRILNAVALTPGVIAQAGDRLVAEFGYSDNNLNTSGRTGTINFGDQTTHSDLPLTVDSGATNTHRPWLEFTLDDPISAPGAPTGLTTTPACTSIDMDWVAPVGGDAPDGYEIRVDGGAPVDVGNVLGIAPGGLAMGTSYLLEVRAYNAGGYSAWTGATDSTLDVPDEPDNLAATPTLTTLDFSWDAAAGADGYEVRIPGVTGTTDVGTDLSHLFTGLSGETSYEPEVRAYNGCGNSDWVPLTVSTQTSRRHPQLGQLVTIDDIAPEYTPLDSEQYQGLLAAFTLTIRGGKPIATVSLINAVGRVEES